MSKIDCIVLDGWHKGHHIVMPKVHKKIVLMKPVTTTVDDCCGGEVVGQDAELQKEYVLAFASEDGKTCLYSTDGKSGSIMHRNWIVPNDRNWLETPLFVSINDPNRAVVDHTTIAKY